MNIYVGNLASDVNEEDLNNLFGEHGKVNSAKVIRDMFSQESRGFGFVEMPGQAEAQKAIENLNTQELKGKKLIFRYNIHENVEQRKTLDEIKSEVKKILSGHYEVKNPGQEKKARALLRVDNKILKII